MPDRSAILIAIEGHTWHLPGHPAPGSADPGVPGSAGTFEDPGNLASREVLDGEQLPQLSSSTMVPDPSMPMGTDVTGANESKPESAPTADAMAQQIANALRARRQLGQPVVLGVDAAHCLCARIPIGDLPRRQRLQPMRYRFEEHVPFAAEELVIDFIVQRDQALGIACPLAWLQPLIDALDHLDVPVRHVCPTALLALEGLRAQHNLDRVDVVEWHEAGGSHLFELDRGTLRQWRWSPHRAQHALWLARLTTVHATQPGAPLKMLSVQSDQDRDDHDATTVATQKDADGHTQVIAGMHMHELAHQHAQHVLQGTVHAPVQLRRDQVAAADRLARIQTPLAAVTAAVIMLFAAVVLSLHLQTQQAFDHIRQLQDQQSHVFQGLYPGQRVPVSVVSRLESEATRLAAVSGSDQWLPQSTALHTLHETLRRLPSAQEMRYRVLEMRFATHETYLEGQARTHGDADRLAASLRRQQGLQTDRPRTEALAADGVAFTLAARLAPTQSDDTTPTTPSTPTTQPPRGAPR